ncbi:hypothetical protein PIB30_064674 [Stylosanthes scabra]|uniref:Uncharacterized protein n=1 Tax=Stylosanthes scabra TaxID=79078 RepID=A0ABU6TLL9_9FABA|nr:hypothetical protein [Stylosanthes scabra]
MGSSYAGKGDFVWFKGNQDQELPFVHISDSHLRLSDLWENGTWHLDGLFTELDDHLRHLIMSINLDNHDSRDKTWIWKFNSSHTYSTREEYDWLADTSMDEILIVIGFGS